MQDKTKEEIAWMVANEYYEVLASKKKGKALRVDCHRATERFLRSMESLRSHV